MEVALKQLVAVVFVFLSLLIRFHWLFNVINLACEYICVVTLCRDFGTKVISVKPLLKQLQTLLEDRDKTVREETKLLVVEIYRWIGPALKPQLTSLKPIQVSVVI